jgi:hypothetical protein
MPLRVFISHAHDDKRLAAALESLISGVFQAGATKTVLVEYSSDSAPGGGITPGASWLDWILTVVSDADVCVVILTSDSVSAPWLTWEAGAVTGVAMARASVSGRGGKATVVPLLFGIRAEDIPEPLRTQQAVSGEQSEGVLKLLLSLHKLSGSSEAFPTRSTTPRVKKFIRDAREALQRHGAEKPKRLRLPEKPASVYFVNGRSGLTLEPWDGEIADGVRLRVRRFTGDSFQGWLLYPVEAGLYRIVTADGTKCLSVQNDSMKSGATVILWEYEGHKSQHWRFVRSVGAPNTMSTVLIVNVASNSSLMPSPDDRQIVQKSGTSLRDQDWWVLVAPDLQAM